MQIPKQSDTDLCDRVIVASVPDVKTETPSKRDQPDDATQSRRQMDELSLKLHNTEKRYSALFQAIDDGFCIIEKIDGEAGAPADFRYIEANPAFDTLTGGIHKVGKTLRQLIPDGCEEFLQTYDTVCTTGKPTRFESELIVPGRSLELYAFLLNDETYCRVGVSFKDITERKRTEELLRRNHDTFTNMIEKAPFGLYVIDAQFRLQQVSAAAQKVFSQVRPLIGRDFEEVLRMVWSDPFASEALGHFRHTLATGESYSAPNTTQLRHDIPDVESYDWWVERIMLPDGQFGVACYFYDISEREKAEHALRDSEERYRNLFNSIDEGFCIIEMIFDENNKPLDYTFLEVNPTFERQTGLLGATGKRIRALLPDIEPYWIETYGKVALTGEPIRLTHEVKALNVVIDVYGCRVGGFESRKVAVVFNNISERKWAEETLRLSEERYRSLFDVSPMAIYSIDIQGHIQQFNRHAVELWGREPTLGDTDERFCGSFKLFLPDGTYLPHDRCPMATVMSGEISEARDAEVIIARADGSRITVVVNIRALKNERDEIIGAINCFYDITERSQLEQKTKEQAQSLIDLDRRKDEFLAMLSHELRGPLAPLANAVKIITLQQNLDPNYQLACNVIEHQIGQLKHLIDDLLEVSRITTGGVQLRRDWITAKDIVERAVETAQPVIEHRGHQFTITVPPQAIWLNADIARLEQVIVNLLINAAKYTIQGGHIWLTVQQENDVVSIRVRDTGIGIPPELLPNIFDLFTQAERSLARSEGGLGLGLCLVKRLVELHGGTVEVQSKVGQGSEFIVRLPGTLTYLPALMLSPPPQVPITQSFKKSCRVLIVDDNVDLVDTQSLLLKMSGHDVFTAHDGFAALEAAINFHPDVVLLDIGLPRLDGFEVAKRIRQQPALKNIVLVAITGYGQEKDRLRSKEAGFDYHLTKPAKFDEVHKILANVLERDEVSTDEMS